MSIAYITIRKVEKRLMARLDRLGHPLGPTARVLAKIMQIRAEIATEDNLKPEQLD